MLRGIVQICQVTRDRDRSIASWIGLYGAGPFFVADFRLEGHHYRGRPVAADVRVGLAFCGSLLIELAQPNELPRSARVARRGGASLLEAECGL